MECGRNVASGARFREFDQSFGFPCRPGAIRFLVFHSHGAGESRTSIARIPRKLLQAGNQPAELLRLGVKIRPDEISRLLRPFEPAPLARYFHWKSRLESPRSTRLRDRMYSSGPAETLHIHVALRTENVREILQIYGAAQGAECPTVTIPSKTFTEWQQLCDECCGSGEKRGGNSLVGVRRRSWVIRVRACSRNPEPTRRTF